MTKEMESLDVELKQIKSKIESKESNEIPKLETKLGEAECELAAVSKKHNKLFEKST